MGGDGYLKNELVKIVNKAKVSVRVFFVGLIEKTDIKDYMNLADVFVYASKSETQGTIITEAMYAGLPIVAIGALGVGDLIEDGKTGLLSTDRGNDFSKKVEELLASEKLIKSLGENARKEAQEKYTSKVCAEEMLEVYKELIGNC
ncbi:MAG: Glycosyltransferase [Candidatus Moranbacteria bacterium GW2011_GWF2_35_54]|nr:MAG: Glycosyltransferase [Candidatus Moranbacteria bacterium GW2011_GWF2_35_54]